MHEARSDGHRQRFRPVTQVAQRIQDEVRPRDHADRRRARHSDQEGLLSHAAHDAKRAQGVETEAARQCGEGAGQGIGRKVMQL